MLDLFLIQLIVVFIVNISGAIDSLKYGISKLLTKGKIGTDNWDLKPFDCSLCVTFWSGMIYLVCVHQFTIPMIAYVCLLAATTDITGDIFSTLKSLIAKLFNWIDERTDRKTA